MSVDSKIEWTDATWNVVTGCTKVSPGCDHCYAERLTERFHGKGSFAEVVLHPERLDLPNRWRKPRRVFVNSMSDLFHKDVPDEFIARVWVVMASTPQHTYQILTKRHGRMRSLLPSPDFQVLTGRAAFDFCQRNKRPPGRSWPLPNVHLGVSVEDQKHADLRISALLDTPAAVRFLSCEPLLGPVNIDRYLWLDGPSTAGPFYDHAGRYRGGGGIGGQALTSVPSGDLHWVIVGGESGAGARPLELDWVRSIVNQCGDAGVPVFVKQLGSVWAGSGKGGDMDAWPADLRVREFPEMTS